MLLPFELDPAIIHHIIYSQAGSIGKAIIELIMNSVDAAAAQVRLTLSKTGFECRDDGHGFASQEDVRRYFGRFGTPHEEGDATYGRFRLGRGQIMAHARTVWTSNRWRMSVDTRTQGYHYEFEELEASLPGCAITGQWYEALTEAELMSAQQEIRDLVRYTLVQVVLNGHVISRDPRQERWDHEDEVAYYRVKEEGAVGIYNQGVLVRHDPGGAWGAGGLIVSKQAIALNVSRTEILRKTCPTWKAIAAQFKRMAATVTARQGAHRKTETRRERAATILLTGDAGFAETFLNEEVITLLPGKRHESLADFLWPSYRLHDKPVAVVEQGHDVPKGESMAHEGLAVLVHPITLDRFACQNAAEFREILQRILDIRQACAAEATAVRYGIRKDWQVPAFASFATLKSAFVDRTQIVTEREALDKETRRAWVALRWCLREYVWRSLNEQRHSEDRRFQHRREFQQLRILLGQSNRAEAWTDGRSYIAIGVHVVERLRQRALETVHYIFGLVDHELAHEGDSLECGHDEAFYQRFHELTLQMAPLRQRLIHRWLMKYTVSMELEGKRPKAEAWREHALIDRVGHGREKRGLPRVSLADTASEDLREAVPAEDLAFMARVNAALVAGGACPPPPDWKSVAEQARQAQAVQEAEWQRFREADEAMAEDAKAYQAELRRVAEILGVAPADIPRSEFEAFLYGGDEETLRQLWADRPWEQRYQDFEDYENDEAFRRWCEQEDAGVFDEDMVPPSSLSERLGLDDRYAELIQPGETEWSLRRNAAVAGFHRLAEYLDWRREA